MPIGTADFLPGAGTSLPEHSAGYDPARPFLFDGLRPRFPTRVIRSCFIPMRDGVRLSTDFSIPIGASLPLPIVLQRTPYDKRKSGGALRHLLPEQGFIYAAQDVRGRYESEGRFEACTGQDREDGVDTLTWLAAQPWCNGAVGMIGSSYSAETAAKAAAMRHANHRCSVIMFDGAYAGGNSQNGAFLQGGVVLLRMLAEWFREHVPSISYGPPPHVDREAWFAPDFAEAYASQPAALPPVDYEALAHTLPVFDMLNRSGAAPSDFEEMIRRSANPADPYWAAQRFLTDADRFHTPTLHVTGPLERGGTSIDNFWLFKRNADDQSTRQHQYLWFTPAQHSGIAQCEEDAHCGARRFGDTRYPYYHHLLDWFGHWLRQDPAPFGDWPAVRYYVGNRNRWREATDWPPVNVKFTRWHLQSKGHANTRQGDGSLVLEVPAEIHRVDRFLYDPATPVPSQPDLEALDPLGGGYADRASLELRSDILIYTSAPLTAPIELAGPVSAELFISSSAPDTDIAVVLSDVDADGRSINIVNGITRLRYRDGLDRSEMMLPGVIYRVTVDLWHAAIEISAGSCLRLAVTSSHFPFYDRNLNTGGDNHADTVMQTAVNSLHHGPDHPSALILPIRPIRTPDAA